MIYHDIDYERLIHELKKKVNEGVISRRFHLQYEIKNLVQRSTGVECKSEEIYKIIGIICELSPEFKLIYDKYNPIDDLVGVQPLHRIGLKHFIEWKVKNA